VIKGVGDTADSTACPLRTPGEHGVRTPAARWQWRTLEVPAEALGSEARRYFEREGFIVDLDALRLGTVHRGEDGAVPAWLVDEPKAWAMVPLLHFDRLVGLVVLARPPHARELDWEDFDLLRVVGRQLASYLAEHAGQEALLDASRFDEFNRRIAFVMHDVKNLASQLSLLCRNAERHGDNPAFRADMLLTVRNAADKLNTLLARLSRYGANPLERLEEVDALAIAQAVAAAQGRAHPVVVSGGGTGCRVIGNRETLEQVLAHLVQNAIDASDDALPVLIKVSSEGLHGAIEVIDSGAGMTPDFVRNRLFKPFVSTKPGGFGIGAFEARELVRAMQGRLDVESREGVGSRFVVRLPLAAAAGILQSLNQKSAGPAPDGSQQPKVA
jgi:putative PEP-CTERM system histidine kinase